MTLIREEVLHRREGEGDIAGPPLLRLELYDLDDGFELRGTDQEGRVHFSFSDPRRMVVMDEYDVTLFDLQREYHRKDN